ncbi:MAG: phosphotransferase [Chthoniobacterales bacterium]|nr:phosphotransferase [Chthoniobacterales bacterium]
MLTPDQLLKKTAERFPAFAGASMNFIHEGGSDRQFYRFKTPSGEGLILVHYNPEKAENNYYAEHAHFLKAHSIHVPAVMEHNAQEHLLWLQDLGEKNLWSQRNQPWDVRRPLYESVLVDVARLHRIPLTAVTAAGITLQKEFDKDLYFWEQDYFLENALGGLFNIDLKTRENLASSRPLQQLATSLAAQPRQLIHRDLQSQNIILLADQPCLIDFQGMRAGLAPYDLASLLYDPYVSILATEREELLAFYQDEMQRHDFVFPFDFKKVFWQCAAQRLMQALGAYGFLSLHRGKAKFQQHVTPALNGFREVLKNLHAEDRMEELEKVLSLIPSTFQPFNPSTSRSDL